MTALAIREATPADLPAIVALLANDRLGATREARDLPVYEAAFARIMAASDNAVMVAEQDGVIVGTYQLTFIDGLSLTAMRRAQIESVRVASGMRGHGLGAAMMTDAVDRARAAGCGMVQLTTNKERDDAHRFYDRLGLVQSHFGYKLML